MIPSLQCSVTDAQTYQSAAAAAAAAARGGAEDINHCSIGDTSMAERVAGPEPLPTKAQVAAAAHEAEAFEALENTCSQGIPRSQDGMMLTPKDHSD